jgi:hypothetical protein
MFRVSGLVLAGIVSALLFTNCGGDSNPSAPSGPPWSVSGTGDTVFDMPRTVERVKIVGDFMECCQNFIVKIEDDLIVNELIGQEYDSTHFEGTYTTSGGTVEIQSSSGVRWTFTEVR